MTQPPSAAPRPAPGARLFLLDEAGLLFAEERQEIHALNTSAAAIWCLMEEGLDADGIAAALGAAAGLDAQVAASFVAAALAHWAARGLLSGADDPSPCRAPTSASPTSASSVPNGLPPWPDPVFAAARHYALGPLRVTIRFTAPEQEALVHPLLTHLEARASPDATVIDVVARRGVGGGGLTLYRDGVACAACGTLDELAPIAKGLVWQAGLGAQRFFLDIHAGVVAGQAGCVLLPAAPGSGKSTLTAALVHAGLDFFSDEVALLADRTLEAIPFPLALCVKDTGLDVVSRLFPQIRALPLHRRGDGKRVAYLPPPGDRIPAHGATRPVAAIVFPRYAPDGAACSCASLGKAEAVERLLAQCLGVACRLDVARVGRLVEWIKHVPCYDLAFADLSAAVEAILRVIEGLKATPISASMTPAPDVAQRDPHDGEADTRLGASSGVAIPSGGG